MTKGWKVCVCARTHRPAHYHRRALFTSRSVSMERARPPVSFPTRKRAQMDKYLITLSSPLSYTSSRDPQAREKRAHWARITGASRTLIVPRIRGKQKGEERIWARAKSAQGRCNNDVRACTCWISEARGWPYVRSAAATHAAGLGLAVVPGPDRAEARAKQSTERAEVESSMSCADCTVRDKS